MSVLTIRAHRRYAVRQPVSLVREAGPDAGGLLIELSSEGCRISGLGRPGLTIGEPVSLWIASRALSGRIRWSHDGIAGVRFDSPLYPGQLAELIATSRMEVEPQRRYGT